MAAKKLSPRAQLDDTNGNRVGHVVAGNTPGDSYKFIDHPKGRKLTNRR